ncbi:HAMP domain-containing sensor histidine kinase [Thermithiobacillus plumbiphilus]|uniref:histidine kinase n=1 Tax=Thermithiobacillus plumbiphilus TaxID=1729899 RepID=A0ABU9DB85_9PROT
MSTPLPTPKWQDIVPPARPGWSSHWRSPLLLLLVLVLAILSVLGFTFYTLRGERALLVQTLKANQQQSLALLSSQTETVLGNAIESPFLVLKNVPLEEVDDDRIAVLRQHFSSVEQVLLLNQHMQLTQRFPPPRSDHEKHLDAWLAGRVQEEYTAQESSGQRSPRFSPHTFIEPVAGRYALFAYQPIADLDPRHEDGFILLRFNVNRLISQHLAPLFADFTREHGGRVWLAPVDSRSSQQALYFPLARYLPGWHLVYVPDPGKIHGLLSHPNWTLLGIAAGVLLVILLAVLAAWWELRQEHALVSMRSQFVASVSHELKTPLALIRMFAETLYLQRVRDPERIHEYHQTILRESERLTRIIGGVLDFSRLNSGARIYELADLDLVSTVNEVLDRYTPHLSENGMQLRRQIGPCLQPVAHDRHGITQILLNLLDNAVKYANAGGRVDVRLQERQNRVELEVVDYGPGIPRAEIQRIRKAAYRGQISPSGRGTGLGLALVDRIAAAHHADFLLDQPQDRPGLRILLSFPFYSGLASGNPHA